MTMNNATICHRVVFCKCEKERQTKLVVLFMFWNKPPKTTTNNALMLQSHKLLFVCLMCYNPNLGLPTKARGCKVASQEGDPGITSHVPRNAKNVRE
jgi:hypothetical protein